MAVDTVYARKDQLESWDKLSSVSSIMEGRLKGLLYEYGVEKLRIAEADQMNFGSGKFWAVTGVTSSGEKGTEGISLHHVVRRDAYSGRTYSYKTKVSAKRRPDGTIGYEGVCVKFAGREWVLMDEEVKVKAVNRHGYALPEEEGMTTRRSGSSEKRVNSERGSVQGTPKLPTSAARSSRASRSKNNGQMNLPGAKAKRDAETWLKKGFITVGFEKATLKALGDGSKEATLRFAVVLDREVAARLPEPIGTAFEEIRRKDTGMGFVEIEAGRIESQNWEFFPWPEKGKPDFEASAVQPEKVELEKDADSGNVLLRFSIRVPLLRDSGLWILTNFGNELWMQYEQAQLTLTDSKAKAAGA